MRKSLIIVLLILALFAGLFLLYQNRAGMYAELVKWKLVPESQTFTELYFDNSLALPKTAVPGQPISFSFSIHNVEGVTTSYPYAVYFLYPDGTQFSFTSGSVTLADNASTSITVSHTFAAATAGAGASSTASSSIQGSVVVSLTQLNQSIDFLLPDTN